MSIQQLPEATERFAALDNRQSLADYNYTHFRSKHFLTDLWATLTQRGISPGDLAPDFELPRADDGSDASTLRLSELRGKPTLLHFGSFT